MRILIVAILVNYINHWFDKNLFRLKPFAIKGLYIIKNS